MGKEGERLDDIHKNLTDHINDPKNIEIGKYMDRPLGGHKDSMSRLSDAIGLFKN